MMTKPTISNNVKNSNKVVKNQLRSRQQPVKSKVVKHFEPSRRQLPWQEQIVQGIPEIDNHVDDKFQTTQKTPRIIQRCRIKPNLEKKSAGGERTPSSDPRKHVTSLEDKHNVPLTSTKKFQSSSSSSVGSCQRPEKKNVKSKSCHSRPITLSAKPGNSTLNQTYTAKNSKTITKNQGDFSSTTDSALLQKNQKLQSLKDEILSNKRTKQFEHFTRSLDGENDVKYGELRDEITKSRMDDVRRRKLWINELKTEIEQFKKFDTFQVYTLQQQDADNHPDIEDKNSIVSGEIGVVDLDIDPETYEDGSGNCSNTTGDEDKGSAITEPLSEYRCETEDTNRTTDSESLNDEAIQHKITEANMLISRVQNALKNIQVVKRKGKHGGDIIEKAINNIKSEAQELITNFRKSSTEMGQQKKLGSEMPKPAGIPLINEFERPKTRRNEQNTTQSLDKFKTFQDLNIENQSSSFELLQDKLNTICETTESDYSTPRITRDKSSCCDIENLQMDAIKSICMTRTANQTKHCVDLGVNTEQPLCSSAETQTYQDTRDIGMQLSQSFYLSNQATQANVDIEGLNTKHMSEFKIPSEKLINDTLMQETRILCCKVPLCPKKSLTFVKQISPNKSYLKSQSFKMEAIKPKNKLKNLSIQKMPAIVIPAQRVVVQTLNLGMDSNGKIQNYTKNFPNVQFVEFKASEMPEKERTISIPEAQHIDFVENCCVCEKNSTNVNPVLGEEEKENIGNIKVSFEVHDHSDTDCFSNDPKIKSLDFLNKILYETKTATIKQDHSLENSMSSIQKQSKITKVVDPLDKDINADTHEEIIQSIPNVKSLVLSEEYLEEIGDSEEDELMVFEKSNNMELTNIKNCEKEFKSITSYEQVCFCQVTQLKKTGQTIKSYLELEEDVSCACDKNTATYDSKVEMNMPEIFINQSKQILMKQTSEVKELQRFVSEGEFSSKSLEHKNLESLPSHEYQNKDQGSPRTNQKILQKLDELERLEKQRLNGEIIKKQISFDVQPFKYSLLNTENQDLQIIFEKSSQNKLESQSSKTILTKKSESLESTDKDKASELTQQKLPSADNSHSIIFTPNFNSYDRTVQDEPCSKCLNIDENKQSKKSLTFDYINYCEKICEEHMRIRKLSYKEKLKIQSSDTRILTDNNVNHLEVNTTNGNEVFLLNKNKSKIGNKVSSGLDYIKYCQRKCSDYINLQKENIPEYQKLCQKVILQEKTSSESTELFFDNKENFIYDQDEPSYLPAPNTIFKTEVEKIIPLDHTEKYPLELFLNSNDTKESSSKKQILNYQENGSELKLETPSSAKNITKDVEIADKINIKQISNHQEDKSEPELKKPSSAENVTKDVEIADKLSIKQISNHEEKSELELEKPSSAKNITKDGAIADKVSIKQSKLSYLEVLNKLACICEEIKIVIESENINNKQKIDAYEDCVHNCDCKPATITTKGIKSKYKPVPPQNRAFSGKLFSDKPKTERSDVIKDQQIVMNKLEISGNNGRSDIKSSDSVIKNQLNDNFIKTENDKLKKIQFEEKQVILNFENISANEQEAKNNLINNVVYTDKDKQTYVKNPLIDNIEFRKPTAHTKFSDIYENFERRLPSIVEQQVNNELDINGLSKRKEADKQESHAKVKDKQQSKVSSKHKNQSFTYSNENSQSKNLKNSNDKIKLQQNIIENCCMLCKEDAKEIKKQKRRTKSGKSKSKLRLFETENIQQEKVYDTLDKVGEKLVEMASKTKSNQKGHLCVFKQHTDVPINSQDDIFEKIKSTTKKLSRDLGIEASNKSVTVMCAIPENKGRKLVGGPHVLYPTSGKSSEIIYENDEERPISEVVFTDKQEAFRRIESSHKEVKAHTTPKLDKEKGVAQDEDKHMIFQSYLLYDNVNSHDPEKLTGPSYDKIKTIDESFYRAYIDPAGNISNCSFEDQSHQNRISLLQRNKATQTNSSLFSALRKKKTDQKNILDQETEMEQRLRANRSREIQIASRHRQINKEKGKRPPKFGKSKKVQSMAIQDEYELGKSRKESIPSRSEDRGSNVGETIDFNNVELTPEPKTYAVEKVIYLERQRATLPESPSEITLTLSYSTSDDSSVNEESKDDQMEKELTVTNLNDTVKTTKITPKDRQAIDQVWKNLKKKYKMEKEREAAEAMTSIVQPLTRTVLDTSCKDLYEALLKPSEVLKRSKEELNNKTSDVLEPSKDSTVNYCFIKNMPEAEKHLLLANNGRYLDEASLFCEDGTLTHKALKNRTNTCVKQKQSGEQQRQEGDKRGTKEETTAKSLEPKKSRPEESSDQTKSSQISKTHRFTLLTTDSSELEALIQNHLLKNNIKRRRPYVGKHKRIISRKHLDSDPTVKIEERRTYFNNWVTYYVKKQAAPGSSAGSSFKPHTDTDASHKAFN